MRLGLFLSILFAGILILSVPVLAQQGNERKAIENLFYSEPYSVIESGIYDAGRRHAIYSYIIANMSTPGFDAMKYLPPDDRAKFFAAIPDKKYTKEVLLEFVMARMSENNRKDSALMTLWKNKKDSLSRIVTLGK
ncbi:hypothetical protein EBR96_00045 [bacterium]|nr:hypothetical protein [bacterium]